MKIKLSVYNTCQTITSSTVIPVTIKIDGKAVATKVVVISSQATAARSLGSRISSTWEEAKVVVAEATKAAVAEATKAVVAEATKAAVAEATKEAVAISTVKVTTAIAAIKAAVVAVRAIVLTVAEAEATKVAAAAVVDAVVASATLLSSLHMHVALLAS